MRMSAAAAFVAAPKLCSCDGAVSKLRKQELEDKNLVRGGPVEFSVFEVFLGFPSIPINVYSICTAHLQVE